MYGISRAFTKTILRYAEEEGVDPEDILAGTGLTPDYFDEVDRFVPLETAGNINRNLPRVFKDPEIGKTIGRRMYALEAAPKQLLSIALLLGSPRLIYRNIVRESKKMNNYIDCEFVDVRRTRAHIITRLKDPSLVQHTDCGFEEGLYQAIPTLWGLPMAQVEQPRCIKRGDDVCEYRISWIQRPSLLQRLHTLFSGRFRAIRELNRQYEQLQGAYQKLDDSYRELEATRNQLADKVEEQTKELEQKNVLMRRFFTSMAHEIRTPLTLLHAPLEAIVQGEFGSRIPKDHEQLAVMQNQIRRIDSIVNTVLSQSKLETDNLSLNRTTASVEGLMGEIVKDSRKMVEGSNLQWEWCMDPACRQAAVSGDQNLLYMAVMNLCSNAVKYNVAGGKVSLEARCTEDVLILECSDGGIGIDPDLAEEIFAYGYQAGDTSGFGIGLFLVKQIIQLHSGRISARSTPGEGSVFTIELPLERNLDGKGKEASPLIDPGMRSWPRYAIPAAEAPVFEGGEDSTLLVIEDEHELRQYLTQALSGTCRVIAVSSAEEAFPVLKSRTVDLVLSDYMLPGMNGMQFYRRVRRRAEQRCIPFILVTAKPDTDLRDLAYREGVLDYIQKPFSLTVLKGKISSLLQYRALFKAGSNAPGARSCEDFAAVFSRYDITPREKDVILLILQGNDRREIAEQLCISPKTVKRHQENIFSKCRVNSKLELMSLFLPPA